MATKLVSVMNTGFRDGFQSCYGARVFTKDFLPAVEAAREAGFTHFEAGGGARFQALYLYCGEDAFDMMDAFRATAGPDANLQTLARGVNVVSLDSCSSDVIDLHAKMFKKHGMTTIRNFDALNDVRNLAFSGKCITDAGLKHEVVVTLMALPPGAEGMYRDGDTEIPAHSADFYTSILRQILDADVPFDSVCFKDASGTVVPSQVYETIKAARKLLGSDVHLRVHTHETAGISVATYKAALDAGADGIDLGMAPASGGTAQPDVITMWHALRGTEFDLGLDMKKVLEAEKIFKECMKDYFMPPEALAVEPLIPFSPMPGGALTANTAMMRDNGMLDRYPEVILAMSETVKRGGFGTSVTPVSQFYFQQAFNNVIFGPWKRISDGYGKMVLGYFGRTPVPPDPEIVALAQEQLGLEPTTEDARAINDRDESKSIAHCQGLLRDNDLEVTDETTFIVAALGQKGLNFLKGDRPIGVRKNVAVEEAPVAKVSTDRYTVTVNGRSYDVQMDGEAAVIDGKRWDVSVAAGGGGAPAAPATTGVAIKAEMPGKVLKIPVTVGQAVGAGDPVVVLEALKMEIPVAAPHAGKILSIEVDTGAQVTAGAVLVRNLGVAVDSLTTLLNSTGLLNLDLGQVVMIGVCLGLLWLAIKKEFEPLLLLPIGFGGLLANVPIADIAGHDGFLGIIYDAGVANGLFPLLIFMGVGSLTDFGPLLANPKTALLGGAAQFGIFATLIGALALSNTVGFIDFSLQDAAAIGIIGGADGPTAIFLASRLAPDLLGAIAVAAYSYMAMVPIIQPPIMRLLTTENERMIVMTQLRTVKRVEKITFPIVVFLICLLLIPDATPLVGALMFGNLMSESGVVDRLAGAARNELINIVTILLGLAVGSKLAADKFLAAETLGILILGLLAFSLGTASGVLMAKLMNLVSKEKINPLIGAAGVSAVPMAARVVNKVGQEANPANYLLMHAMGPNVSGVLGSAVAAGVLLALVG